MLDLGTSLFCPWKAPIPVQTFCSLAHDPAVSQEADSLIPSKELTHV